MPYAFSPVQPPDTGRVSQVDVPMGAFLGASFDQGVHDSMFSSIMHMTEYQLENEGKMLDPGEANKLYGQPGLTFDEPVTEGRARLLSARKQDENRRLYLLSQGNPDGLASFRGATGLVAGLAGGMSNPLDFAMNFMPIVGSEEKALAASNLGRGAFRQTLARGLLTTEESLARRIPYAPRLTSSMIQGGVGNIINEIPHAISAFESKENYTALDSLKGIAFGTAFSGILHLAVTGAARVLEHVTPATLRELDARALDQTLKGQDIRVDNFVKLDEGVIRAKVKFDALDARDRAIASLSFEDIRAAIKAKYKENTVAAAFRFPDGTVKTAALHSLIDLTEHEQALYSEGKFEDGFTTDKGRFISRQESYQIAGLGDPSLRDIGFGPEYRTEAYAEETTNLDMENLMTYEHAYAEKLRAEGATEAQIINALREKRVERADNYFFSQDSTKQRVHEEADRQVQAFMDEERAKYDEDGKYHEATRAEVERQIKEGKTLTPEDEARWAPGRSAEKARATLQKSLDEHTAELKQQAKELADEMRAMTPEEAADSGILDQWLETLESLKVRGGNVKEGVTGMPVWLWNGAIDATIAAIKAGKLVKDAILIGAQHVRDNYWTPYKGGQDMAPSGYTPAIKTKDGRVLTARGHEGHYDVAVGTDGTRGYVSNKTGKFMNLMEVARAENPDLGKPEKEGMDRRGFLGLIAKVTAAAASTNPADIVKAAVSVKEVAAKKIVFPKITIEDLFFNIERAANNDAELNALNRLHSEIAIEALERDPDLFAPDMGWDTEEIPQDKYDKMVDDSVSDSVWRNHSLQEMQEHGWISDTTASDLVRTFGQMILDVSQEVEAAWSQSQEIVPRGSISNEGTPAAWKEHYTSEEATIVERAAQDFIDHTTKTLEPHIPEHEAMTMEQIITDGEDHINQRSQEQTDAIQQALTCLLVHA